MKIKKVVLISETRVLNRIMKSGERKQGTQAERLPQQAFSFSLQPSAFSLRAFTLIEFIGALAVIALLASALFPVVIRQIDRAAKTAETQNMQAISSNFVAYVVGTRSIPLSTWGNAVATYMNKPVSGITSNARGVTRVLLFDKNGWLQTNGLTYPVSQPVGGFSCPGGARLLIVSSIDAKNAVPNLGGADFQTTWDWDPAVSPAVPASGNWNGWAGSGYDVVIQRINLQPLFHHVLLFSQSARMSYTVNGLATTNDPVKADGYYLDGSVLGLYTNFVDVTSTNLQVTEIINRDISRYLFSGWSDEPGPGPPTASSSGLDSIAYAFINSPSPPATKRGDNTYGIAGTLLSYLSSYSSWANLSTCFDNMGANNNKQVPQGQIITTVNTCFGNSGVNGCMIVP